MTNLKFIVLKFLIKHPLCPGDILLIFALQAKSSIFLLLTLKTMNLYGAKVFIIKCLSCH